MGNPKKYGITLRGGEQGALTRARQYYHFGKGIIRYWKKRFSKRARKTARQNTASDAQDY